MTSKLSKNNFQTSVDDPYGFDTPIDRTYLSTKKWEAEIARTNNPDLLCFGTAEMDFAAAPAINQAMQRVVENKHFGYPSKRDSYFDAVIEYFERHFDWRIDKDWISSNVGVYPAMQSLIEELTEPGDEILYQTPVHHVFEELITASGRVAVPNQLLKRNGHYEMNFEDLARCVTPRSKLFLLCSPHNPVGRVWRREELEQLNRFCLAHGLIVVTDEVYCGLLYKGVPFTPFASLSDEASLNSVTLVSASKSFNTTGLKHALMIAESEHLQAAYSRGLKRSNLGYGGSIFGEAATEAAFRDCDHWSEALMHYIEGNFKRLKSKLAQDLPLVTATQPEATYFAWLDFSALGLTDAALQRFFETEAQVNLVTGASLGPGGEGHVRFNLATTRACLSEGLNRISTAWRQRQTHDA
ncbi:MalY/PatB family protein [Agarivorans sp. QJM3NY_33]|uniref:MalY/PatB family protein n=1 Tax=Agarivorans sp. QJM3NY_33 TaxID=3421432 RepID=UPI003D7E1F90